MKKLLCVLLSLILVLGMAACGGDTTTTTEPEATATAQPTATAAPTAEPEQEKPEGTLLETAFWSMYYTEDWVVDEERTDDGEKYATRVLEIPEGDGYSIQVNISVYKEDCSDYRDDLSQIDELYNIIENNSVAPETLGDLSFYVREGEYWGETTKFYSARDEGANVSAYITVYGDYDDARVAELLGTMTFTLEDIGNVDYPYPWNGEPFIVEEALTKMVGTYNLSSVQLPLSQSLVVDDIFSGRIGLCGDTVYVLCDKVLKQYAYDGIALTFEKDIELPDEYEEISVGADGTVYLSSFGNDFIGIKDGAQVFSFAGPDYVAMDPTGTWGISYFTSKDVEKITISGGALSTEAMTLAEVGTISSVHISENYILIGCSTEVNENEAIVVYDHDFNLVMIIGDTAYGEGDYNLGSLTWVGETANGIVALDGNMRRVFFWATDGTFIGEAGAADLFDTTYPWISGAAQADGGSILICMTEERADCSADEYLVFRLTGF